MSKPQTAFLGAGIMGRPMARNLLSAGYPLTVWNRTREKAQALTEHGATVADTPAAAAQDAQFIFVMVSDAKAADAVLFGDGDGALSRHPRSPRLTERGGDESGGGDGDGDGGVLNTVTPGATVIVCSTLTPRVAKTQAEKCRQRGVDYLDAPVSGGEKGAVDGTLAIMVGGAQEVYDRAEKLLRTLGRPMRIGGGGCGQLAKLANQAIVGASIAAVTEALLLAKAGGADIAAVRQALTGGFADSTVLQQHGRRMVERDFAPGGPAKYQLRDLQNAVHEAAGYGITTPVTTAAMAMFDEMIHGGDGDAHGDGALSRHPRSLLSGGGDSHGDGHDDVAGDGDSDGEGHGDGDNYAELDHSALFKYWQTRASSPS